MLSRRPLTVAPARDQHVKAAGAQGAYANGLFAIQLQTRMSVVAQLVVIMAEDGNGGDLVRGDVVAQWGGLLQGQALA